MGRKAFCTREEVFTAADEIAGNGAEVTVRSLHTYLGGGSFTSVLRYLADWRRERRDPVPQKLEAPSAIADIAGKSLAHLWDLAFKQATENLEAERQRARDEVVEANLRAADAISHAEDLANKINEMHEASEQQSRKIQELEDRLSLSETSRAALEGSNSELAKQVENLNRSIDSWQQKNDLLKDNYDKEVSRLASQAAKLEAEREAARTDVQKYQERVIAASDDARAQSDKFEAKLQEVNREREKALEQLSELRGKLTSIEEQHKQLLSTLKIKGDKRS
jgi:chromosome segregation ATPase